MKGHWNASFSLAFPSGVEWSSAGECPGTHPIYHLHEWPAEGSHESGHWLSLGWLFCRGSLGSFMVSLLFDVMLLWGFSKTQLIGFGTQPLSPVPPPFASQVLFLFFVILLCILVITYITASLMLMTFSAKHGMLIGRPAWCYIPFSYRCCCQLSSATVIIWVRPLESFISSVHSIEVSFKVWRLPHNCHTRILHLTAIWLVYSMWL